MLLLFETPAGYALLKVLDEGKLRDVDNIFTYFQSAESASKLVKLTAFSKFDGTEEAVAAAASLCENKLDKGLKKFLKKNIVSKELSDELGVIDAKLGGLIKDKLGISCIHDNVVEELLRGVRNQMHSLLTGLSEADYRSMVLGLSHSLCRYKIKFSPDKVDTMIIQAIGLLDELDKELNTYAMRVREWYGWHFPELGKIVADNIQFAKSIRKMGMRTNAATTDLSDILPEEVEQELKEAAEVSMGTEISEEDLMNIQALAEQVISIADYRASLFDYLKNRMNAIAPNLTVMVGELVGARLIAHAGSLLSLAKHPASTVQILGAEKALFRALKTKHETPKYGLLYHASLVGQAAPKLKGKIARVVANKTALSVRVDAMADTEGVTVGLQHREAVENRLRQLEGGKMSQMSGTGKGRAAQAKFTPKSAAAYNPASDNAFNAPNKKRKNPEDDTNGDDGAAKKSKKDKKKVQVEEDDE
eukprot:TRINITY_DN2764_c0_g2_i9.p2 TRINITY_DN2764_c0_g2~~TRINITY_DN2764_c0_g2_i9.p2  ORF type:complete len:476 (-),score=194.61 TRINITY_DN2764_c0_g2_i9:196-1623(-)